MTAGIRITFDDRDLQRWGQIAVKLIERNARNAIDKAARKARAEAIEVMARDLNVPKARFRAAVPLVRGTRPGSLKATWTVGKVDNRIRGEGGKAITYIPRGQAVNVSTYAVSGGGSAHLTLSKGFTLRGNGGSAVMIRLGPGRGNIRPVYAGRPNTSMTGGRAPQRTWERVADERVRAWLGPAIQAAFDGTSSSSPSASDDMARRNA